MDEKERILCAGLIDKWQSLLRMNHWDISMSENAPLLPEHVMECHTNLLRTSARIRVKPDLEPGPEMELLLVHELIHPLLESIRDEHRKQLKALEVDPARHAEYEERMLDRVEVAVDHLSKVLYSLDPYK